MIAESVALNTAVNLLSSSRILVSSGRGKPLPHQEASGKPNALRVARRSSALPGPVPCLFRPNTYYEHVVNRPFPAELLSASVFHTLFFLLVAFLPCSAALADPGRNVATITKMDLLALVKTQKAALSSLSFESEVIGIQYVSNAPDFCSVRDGLRWRVERYVMMGQMRRLEETYGPDPENPIRSSVETWNGTVYKKFLPVGPLGPLGDIDGSVGKEYGHEEGKFWVCATPLDFALLTVPGESSHLANGPDLETVLDSKIPSVILPGVEQVDGSNCLVLAQKRSGDQTDPLPLVWLDIDHGFAAKQSIVYFSPEDGVTKKVLLSRKYQEISPGLWVATEGHIQFFGPPPDAPTNQEVLLSENVYTFKNISYNQPIEPSEFDFHFPSGTHVLDRRNGISYVAGAPDLDSMLKHQVDLVRANEKLPEQPSSDSRAAQTPSAQKSQPGSQDAVPERPAPSLASTLRSPSILRLFALLLGALVLAYLIAARIKKMR